MNEKQAKALLIEDDPLYAQAIRGLFMAKRVAFELDVADHLAAGLKRLAQNDIDVVLLDLALPDSEGIDTFARVHAAMPDLPIIVLTGSSDDELAIQAMQAGAQDYLVKGEINRHLLQRAMRYAMERQRSETALRETQRLIQEIADVTPEIVNIYDLDAQRNVYVNRQLANLLGYETGRLSELTPRDWVAPDDYTKLEKLFAELRTAADGELRELEYRARHQNGTWRWLHSELTVFARNEQGLARQILISSHDITERRQAAEALRQSEERYRDLVENSGLYLLSHDLQGRVLDANHNVLEFLGLQKTEELRSFHVGDFIVPDELVEYQDYLRAVNDMGQAQGTTKVQAPDGRLMLLEYDSSRRQVNGQWLVRCVGRDVTERLHATAAVRSSEDRYQDVVENSGLLIGTHDVDGNFLSVNETTWRFFGFQRASDLIGRSIRGLLTADVREHFEAYLRKVVAGGTAEGAMRVTLASGQERLLEYDNSLRQEQPDQPAVVRFIARDVTERHEQERKIRESEERFRLIAENASDMIGRYSLTGETLYASPAIVRVLGYTPEDRLGRSVYELFHPDDVEMVRQAHRELLGQSGTKTLIFRYRRKDGQYVWFESSVRALRNPATGAVEELQAVTRDITDRKHADDAMRESEERYRDLFENANDVVFTTDLTGQLTSFNHTGELLTGYTREEVLNQNALIECVPQFYRIAQHLLEGSRTSQSKAQYELIVTARTGETLIFEVSARLISKNARPMGVQGIARDVTERKRVEAQIRENEERYRTLFEDASDVVCTLDLAGCFTALNRAGERLLGYQREALKDKSFLQLVAPSTQASAQQMIERKLAGTDDQANYELDMLTCDGQIIPLEFSSRLIYKDQQPIGLQAIARDITERKRVEEERTRLTKERDAERTLLQAVLKQMPAGVMITEAPSERLVLVNENAIKILRCTPKELREGFRLEAYGFDGKRIRSADMPMTRAIRSGEVISGEEMYLRRSDGAMVTARVEAAPIQRGGRIVAGVMAFSDITERKLADEQLREQAALLDCAQDAIAVLDLDGYITFWNSGAERLYGWTKAEALHQSVAELLLPTAHQQVMNDTIRQLLEKNEWKGELTELTKDKREIVVESRCTLVREDSGKPKSILVINTDVTSRRQLEAQVLRMQRTESIGSLASGIAHDLNNALAPILMALHTLQQKFTDASSQHWLGLIRKSAERSRDLVDQVLTFARGVSGERLPLEFGEVIQESARILHETLPKNIRLQVQVSPDLWQVIGDRTQISQVFMNLCINARDAMPDGGSLEVRLQNVQLGEQDIWMHEGVKPGPFVQLWLADSGAGIPPEILNRIFDPFFTTKELGKGTGLGLSTSLGIIKGHGGFINVESTLGKGTQFTVYLPANQTASKAVSNQAPLLPPPPVLAPMILVIDDEETLLEVTKATLESAGYRVLAVSNGEAGLGLYRQRHVEIGIVVTDLSMPGLDGLAASAAMRVINPAVKIIATSGLRSQTNMQDAQRAGISAFLWKPYTADELLEQVATLLRQPVA